jgi:hypothetical protein
VAPEHRQPSPRATSTKYERALVRPGIASILAIPIFDRPGQLELDTLARVEPIGVLCLDSDGLLETEYDDMEFLLWLAEMTETLDDIVKGLRKRDTD